MKKSRKKAVGRRTRKKKLPNRAARKRPRTISKATARKTVRKKKTTAAPKKRARERGYVVDTLVGLDKPATAPPGLQSGDLQGLSNEELVDSQSVDELLEEGNAFEASVVAGVEDSKDAGTREVRTREVPVDDVPEEYLDRD